MIGGMCTITGGANFGADLTVEGAVAATTIELTGSLEFGVMEATNVNGVEVIYGVFAGSNVNSDVFTCGDVTASVMTTGFTDVGQLVAGTGTFAEVTAAVLIGYPCVFPFCFRRRQRILRGLQQLEEGGGAASMEDIRAEVAAVLDASSTSAKLRHHPTIDREKAALLAVFANHPNDVGQLSGTHWYSAHPFEIDPGVNISGQSLLALKTDGDVRINGVLYASIPPPITKMEDNVSIDNPPPIHHLSDDGEGATSLSSPAFSSVNRSCYIASGKMPSGSFHARIPPGSILIDGTAATTAPAGSSSSKGCLHASTSSSSHVAPIYSTSVDCSIPSGNVAGSSSTIHLPSPYAIGRIASFQSTVIVNAIKNQSQIIPPPSALVVKAMDKQGMNYTVECQATSSPVPGEVYNYHSKLIFLHPILVHSHTF